MTDKPLPEILPEKRARVQRNTNSDYLGRAHAATVVDVEDVEDDENDGDADEVDSEPVDSRPSARTSAKPTMESDQEAAPETFAEAARDPRWVQSISVR